MAKDKKTDYSKLTLGRKKPVKKKVAKAPDVDKIVEKIHIEEPAKKVEVPEAAAPPKVEEKIPTKRITLDIPVPLHKKIRIRTFGMGITMKQYFLDLAEKELRENE